LLAVPVPVFIVRILDGQFHGNGDASFRRSMGESPTSHGNRHVAGSPRSGDSFPQSPTHAGRYESECSYHKTTPAVCNMATSKKRRFFDRNTTALVVAERPGAVKYREPCNLRSTDIPVCCHVARPSCLLAMLPDILACLWPEDTPKCSARRRDFVNGSATNTKPKHKRELTKTRVKIHWCTIGGRASSPSFRHGKDTSAMQRADELAR